MGKNDIYKKAHQVWDRQHQVGSPTYYLRKSLLKKRIKQFIKPHNQVLDVGCGTGDYLLEMAKYNVQLNGFDLSEYAVEQARIKLKNRLAELIVSDIEHFQSEKKYDFILVSEVLEHIEDDLAGLRKISQYLKSGGRIIITVPFDPNLWIYESHRPYDDLRRYSKESLNQLVVKAGLKILRLDCYGFPFLRTYYRLTKSLRKKPISTSMNRNLIIRLSLNLFKIIVNFDKLFLSTNKGIGLILVAQKNG